MKYFGILQSLGFFKKIWMNTLYTALAHKIDSDQSAKFVSSNNTRTTFAFDACFVRNLLPLADERKCFFHRIFIATIDAIEQVFNVETRTWHADSIWFTTCNVCSIHNSEVNSVKCWYLRGNLLTTFTSSRIKRKR
jgi:hypothetical protein